MFKVGDVIVPLPSTDNKYNWTNQRYHWKGIVLEVNSFQHRDIMVKTLECDKCEGFADTWWVESKYFKLEVSLKDFIKSLTERKTVEREGK